MEGGALFTFELREGRMPQRWRNVVHKTRHSASLQQTREVVRGDRLRVSEIGQGEESSERFATYMSQLTRQLKL